MLIVYKTYEPATNPLTEENFADMQNALAAEYKNTEANSFVPRLFGILDVSEENTTMKLNFHLTNTLNQSIMNFGVLQNISSNNLKEFKYETFLSADRCIGFQLAIGRKPVTWPTVNIGEILESAREGFCVDSTGAIVHMRCEGK